MPRTPETNQQDGISADNPIVRVAMASREWQRRIKAKRQEIEKLQAELHDMEQSYQQTMFIGAMSGYLRPISTPDAPESSPIVVALRHTIRDRVRVYATENTNNTSDLEVLRFAWSCVVSSYNEAAQAYPELNPDASLVQSIDQHIQDYGHLIDETMATQVLSRAQL